MKRRTLLGFTASVFGTSLAVGSGAFNTTRADREIDVDVVNDTEAYLQIEPLGTTNREGEELSRSYRSDKTTQFRFPGTNEKLEGLVAGEGLGSNSEYYFDSLAKIGNQGTETIALYSNHQGDLSQVSLYKSGGQDRTLLTDEGNSLQLGTGETFEAGIYIDTTGTETEQTIKDTLTIVGKSLDD